MANKKQPAKSVKKSRPARPVSSGNTAFWSRKEILYPLLLILAVTFIAFIPSLQNGFVNWDDDVNIMENKNLDRFDGAAIKAIFSSHVIGNYNPLPILMFSIEKHVLNPMFGKEPLDPFLFHFNNLLLHLICVALVFRLSMLLGLSRNAAIVTALLFGIHPMRVESVAWITERKDVLFAAFFFGSLINYIKYQTSRKTSHLLWVYILFIVALFAKIQAVTLPLTMLAVDYLLKRPLKWKLVWEKIPYFALSTLFGLIGIYFLATAESLDQTKAAYNLAQRLCIGAYSYLVYLYKAVFPYPMSPLYPYPKTLPIYIYLAVLPLLALLFLLYRAFVQKKTVLVFGFAFFTFNVMFLLQVLGAGQGFLADRFTYVPYYGLFFAGAWYLDKYGFSAPKFRTASFASVGALLLLYFGWTWQQNKIWENGGTLWTHVLKYHRNVTLPFGNRANYYRENGESEKALADYNESLRLEPGKATVYNSRGKLFFNLQKFQEAAVDYTKAIELDPATGEYYINRAAAYASIGDFERALQDATKGLEVDPKNINGYRNRFLIFQSLNRYDESILDIDKLIEITPYDANLYYEKARAYRILRRTQESIPWYDKSIELNPGNGLFLLERGKAHLNLGNKVQARADLQRAAQLGTEVDPGLFNQLN